MTALIAILAGLFSQAAAADLTVDEQRFTQEGYTIIMSVLLVVSATAALLYIKDHKFQQLVQIYREEKSSVLRGRDGYTFVVPSQDLVVGDVVCLEEGQRVPADCLLLEAYSLVVDETKVAENPHRIIPKRPLAPDNFSDSPNPFLFGQSLVVQGNGKALVCAVGERTYMGKKAQRLNTEAVKTPTQKRLSNIAREVEKIGVVLSTLIFIIQCAHLIRRIMTEGDRELVSLRTFQELNNALSTALALVVVAVPEGLPMAISIGLAFQIRNKSSMVRTVSASEQIGGA